MPKEKSKKVIGLTKDEFGGKIIKETFGLGAKTYSFLINDASEDKKAKYTKKCETKRKLKFEDCKNCLEATQLENKMNYLERNDVDVNSLKKCHKEFMKNNKLILKTQQRFKSGRHNFLLKKIIKLL